MFRKRTHQQSPPRQAAGLFGAVDEAGIVVFFGALTAEHLAVFFDVVRDAPRPVRIDLGLLERIDAAGVDALLDVDDAACDASGVGIDLTAMSRPVRRMLREAGFAPDVPTGQQPVVDRLAGGGSAASA